MKTVQFFSVALLLSCASQLRAEETITEASTCSREQSPEAIQRFLDALNKKCPNYVRETATPECQQFVEDHALLMQAALAQKTAVETAPAVEALVAPTAVCLLAKQVVADESTKDTTLVEAVATAVPVEKAVTESLLEAVKPAVTTEDPVTGNANTLPSLLTN